MRGTNETRTPEPIRSGLVLYVAFAAAVALLWLERHAALTQTDHTVALLGIVLVFFVVTAIWLSGESR
jgi:hypothetical protein